MGLCCLARLFGRQQVFEILEHLPYEIDEDIKFKLLVHWLITIKPATMLGHWFWFVLLLYVPSQQLWSLRDGQLT